MMMDAVCACLLSTAFEARLFSKISMSSSMKSGGERASTTWLNPARLTSAPSSAAVNAALACSRTVDRAMVRRTRRSGAADVQPTVTRAARWPKCAGNTVCQLYVTPMAVCSIQTRVQSQCRTQTNAIPMRCTNAIYPAIVIHTQIYLSPLKCLSTIYPHV